MAFKAAETSLFVAFRQRLTPDEIVIVQVHEEPGLVPVLDHQPADLDVDPAGLEVGTVPGAREDRGCDTRVVDHELGRRDVDRAGRLKHSVL